MVIDTTRTIEIEGSPLKLFGLAALGVLMTGLAAAMMLGYIPAVSQNDWRYWVVAFGVVFFAFAPRF